MSRTPLRAHIHAVFATSRSRDVVPTPAAAGTPSSALAGTGPSEGRWQRAEQDPQVEPQRPVADVERIPRFLAGHVGHRSLTHLPHAAETGPHLVTKGAKLCGELGEVVVREWPRTHQAHVTLDDVPELRQLIDAEPAQPVPDVRNHARVDEEL